MALWIGKIGVTTWTPINWITARSPTTCTQFNEFGKFPFHEPHMNPPPTPPKKACPKTNSKGLFEDIQNPTIYESVGLFQTKQPKILTGYISFVQGGGVTRISPKKNKSLCTFHTHLCRGRHWRHAVCMCDGRSTVLARRSGRSTWNLFWAKKTGIFWFEDFPADPCYSGTP